MQQCKVATTHYVLLWLTSTHSYYLKESVSIAEKLPYSKGYLARANYRLGRLFASQGEERQCELYMQTANTARNEIPHASEGLLKNPSEDDKFNILVPWMLW